MPTPHRGAAQAPALRWYATATSQRVGTNQAWIHDMGALDHSLATLRFSGDDLVPETLTTLLGPMPSKAFVKGQDLNNRSVGMRRVARTGSWQLSAERREPEDLESQIFELLARVTDDLSI
jgi:hypothetical protein